MFYVIFTKKIVAFIVVSAYDRCQNFDICYSPTDGKPVGCIGFTWILYRTNLYFNLSNGIRMPPGVVWTNLLVTWQDFIRSKTSRLVDFRTLQSCSPLFPLKFLSMEFRILKNCPITRKMINQQGSCRIFLNWFWSHLLTYMIACF